MGFAVVAYIAVVVYTYDIPVVAATLMIWQRVLDCDNGMIIMCSTHIYIRLEHICVYVICYMLQRDKMIT